MPRQSTTGIPTRQSAICSGRPQPPLLRDLIDRQMLDLTRIEEGVACGAYLSFGNGLEGGAAYRAGCLERMIAIITDPAHPRKWFNTLRFRLGLSGPETSALIRHSKSAGNPSPQFELVVSLQIMESLMRGHVLAAVSQHDDQDDDDCQLVCA